MEYVFIFMEKGREFVILLKKKKKKNGNFFFRFIRFNSFRWNIISILFLSKKKINIRVISFFFLYIYIH